MENMNNINEGRLWELIALLREHCRKHYGFKDNDVIDIDHDSVQFHLYHNAKRYFSICVEKVISKKFGFIKWLVDNDKIEFREDFYLEDQHGGGFGEDENIIMLLSIQDNPIDFLISILK